MRGKVFTVATLFAGCALATSGCSTSASATPDRERSIAGTWTVTVDPDGAPRFQSTITFTNAGGVVESTNKAVSSAGVGVWTKAGDGDFKVTFRKYRFNATGAFIGTTVIVEDDVLDASGASYTGHATTKLLDVNGAVQTSFTSTAHADRMS
jgi:hypothetical protein